MFNEPEKIRALQIELNRLILESIHNIVYRDELAVNDNMLDDLNAPGYRSELLREEDIRISQEAVLTDEETLLRENDSKKLSNEELLVPIPKKHLECSSDGILTQTLDKELGNKNSVR